MKPLFDIDVKPETVTEENLAPIAKETTSELDKETAPIEEPKKEENLKAEVKKVVSEAKTKTEKKLENLQEKK